MPTAIEQRYVELHSRSAGLAERGREDFPDGVTHEARRMSPFPIYMTRGTGSQKWDVDGNEYVEFRTGHGSMILGQAHPEIVKAVQERVAQGTHLSASTELEIEWADRVKSLIPCAEKVRFHSSGTEAVMMAFRMARAYTGRAKVVKFQEHFHGWSDYSASGGAAGVSGIPAETASTMVTLPVGDAALVESVLSKGDVAAVILEPTGAHMGAEPIRPEFLHELRDITSKYGVIFIMDEVVTGFRVSPGGAQARFQVTPDLCTLAKILAGGLPGGAVAGRADIVDAIERREIIHQGTFNANPLSASAGTTALRLIATEPVNATADAAAERLRKGLNDLFARMEVPGHAFGIASAVHTRIGISGEIDEYGILQGEPQGAPISAEVDHQLAMAMYNHGVDSHRRFLTAMTHTDSLIDKTLNAFEQSVVDLRRESLL